MLWKIYALYECVWESDTSNGLSKVVGSMIGVKQRYQITSRDWALQENAWVEIAIQMLLYADDIVLISDLPEELQRYRDASKLFLLIKLC